MKLLGLGGLLRKRAEQAGGADGATKEYGELGVASDPLRVVSLPSLGSRRSARANAPRQTTAKTFSLARSRSQLLVDLKWTEDAEHQPPEPLESVLERAQAGVCSAKESAERELCDEEAWRHSTWRRRLLPAALVGSTAGGAVCMATAHRAALTTVLGGGGALRIAGAFLLLDAVTLGCMAYAALVDPGQLNEEQSQQQEPPRRSHKTWQYERRVRRFDHYCRWLTNAIGLRNHREFLVMVVCLVANAVLGVAMDLALAPAYYCAHGPGWHTAPWYPSIQGALVVHLVVQAILAYYAIPILRLHVGFVSRNELAQEWKEDTNYVVFDENGEPRDIDDLDEEEYDELYDDFVYVKERNVWDQGCMRNWMLFWCAPRCDPAELGEF